MLFESGISTPLQALGVKESTANSIAGWSVFAGSLAVGKMSSVRGLRAAEGLSNAEIVEKAGEKAFRNILGKGPIVGIERHEYATEMIERYQNLYGSRGLLPKVRSADGKAILDILDSQNSIIYDWKFGNSARMSNTQFLKYQFYFPDNQIIPLLYKYP